MKGLNGSRTFVVRMPDDSMAPLFGEGDYIHVDPDRSPAVGRYVAVWDGVPPATTVRLLVEADGRRVLRATRDGYPEIVVDADNEADIRGVAVFAGRAI